MFFHWWWVARAHHFFQSLVVGFVRGANVAILTSEFVGSEILESDDAFLYFGKEGGVSFGFVWARDPAQLKADLKRQQRAGTAKVRDAVD